MTMSPDAEAVIESIRVSPLRTQIRELVESASAEELLFEPAPGEWSIVEMLRHMGDTEEMRHMRFDRMLAEDNPLLDRPIPGAGERDSQDGEVLLQRYERLVARALERVSAMSDSELRRVGTQAPDPQVNRVVNSPTNVLEQAGRLNTHARQHLEQIQANLAAYKQLHGAPAGQR